MASLVFSTYHCCEKCEGENKSIHGDLNFGKISGSPESEAANLKLCDEPSGKTLSFILITQESKVNSLQGS